MDRMRHLRVSERDELIVAIIMNELMGAELPLMSEDAMMVWDEIAKTLKQRVQLKARRERRRRRTMIATETEQNNEREEGSPAPLNEDKENKKEKEESKSAADRKFEECMARDYPNLARMESPLSLTQFQRLLEEYPYTLIMKILARMNLYKNIEIKYSSVYLTAINWLKREISDLKACRRWSKYEKELKTQQETIEKLKRSSPDLPLNGEEKEMGAD